MARPVVNDLRSYLEVLEQEGELARIKVPVDLNQEIGAICYRNLHKQGPLSALGLRPIADNGPVSVGLRLWRAVRAGLGGCLHDIHSRNRDCNVGSDDRWESRYRWPLSRRPCAPLQAEANPVPRV